MSEDGVAIPSDCHMLAGFFRDKAGMQWPASARQNWNVSAAPSLPYAMSTCCPRNSSLAWHGVTCNSAMNHVERLELALGTAISGPIPAYLAQLTELRKLDLSSNGLSGAIPSELGALQYLQDLRLYSNQLTGSIPDALYTLRNLTVLSLWNNKLTGSLNSAIGQLSQLQTLAIASNQLSGSLPPELGQLHHLNDLTLFANAFSGAIPAALTHLSSISSTCRLLSKDDNSHFSCLEVGASRTSLCLKVENATASSIQAYSPFNDGMATLPNCTASSRLPLTLIITAAVCVPLLLMVLAATLYVFHKRRQQRRQHEKHKRLLVSNGVQDRPKRLSSSTTIDLSLPSPLLQVNNGPMFPADPTFDVSPDSTPLSPILSHFPSPNLPPSPQFAPPPPPAFCTVPQPSLQLPPLTSHYFRSRKLNLPVVPYVSCRPVMRPFADTSSSSAADATLADVSFDTSASSSMWAPDTTLVAPPATPAKSSRRSMQPWPTETSSGRSTTYELPRGSVLTILPPLESEVHCWHVDGE